MSLWAVPILMRCPQESIQKYFLNFREDFSFLCYFFNKDEINKECKENCKVKVLYVNFAFLNDFFARDLNRKMTDRQLKKNAKNISFKL